MKWDGKAVSGYQNLDFRTKVFIYLESDIKPSSAGVLKDGQADESLTEAAGRNAAIILSFPARAGTLKLRYGISFIDTDQAKKNLEREIKEPLLETNIIRSFLRMTEQMENPWMPTFPEITGDSRRMNSNHGKNPCSLVRQTCGQTR